MTAQKPQQTDSQIQHNSVCVPFPSFAFNASMLNAVESTLRTAEA